MLSRMRVVRSIIATGWLASCGSPQAPVDHPTLDPVPHTAMPHGPFGVYVWRPHLDPFPDAPESSGWGASYRGDVVTHTMVLSATPDEAASQALARRGQVTAQLPDDARLVFEVTKPYPRADEWSYSSVVVTSAPVLTTADLTSCTVVERPYAVIDLSNKHDNSGTWPYLALAWPASTKARLDDLVALDPDLRLYAGFGDDIVDDWAPGHATNGTAGAELRVPAPDAATARARVATMPCSPAH